MDDIYKIGDVIRIISTNEDVNNHIFLIREISRSRNNTEIVLMDQYDSNFKYFLNVSPSGKLKNVEIISIAKVDKTDIGLAVSKKFVPGETVAIIYKSDDKQVGKITGEIIELNGNVITVMTEQDLTIYIDVNDLSNMPFKLELNAEKNKIVESEEWIQFEYDEEIVEEKKRYDFKIQKNDMKNSITNVNGMSETQTKIINTTITRFVQLREQFSIFNGVNVIGIKEHDAKPLVNTMLTFNQKLYWIIACCAIIKKIYDCGDIKRAKRSDVYNVTSEKEIREEINIIRDYESKRDITYSTFIEHLNMFSASYLEPVASDLYKSSVMSNITSVVSNDGKLFSNVAAKYDGKKNKLYDNVISKKRFLLQNYDSATIGSISVKLPNGELVTQHSVRTDSDSISVNSILTLPKIAALFSRINLFNADIMTRAKLNLIFLQYSQILTRKMKVNSVDISPSNPLPESNNFYSTLTHFMWKQSDSAYTNCLPILVPDNYALFENIIEYADPGVSLYAVVELMEPYMVYYDNIVFEQYSKMCKRINSNILKFNNNFNQNLNLCKSIVKIKTGSEKCRQGESTKDNSTPLCDEFRYSVERMTLLLKIDCAIQFNDTIALINSNLLVTNPDAIKDYIEGLTEDRESSECNTLTKEECITNPDCISDKGGVKKVVICNSYEQQSKDINESQMRKNEDEIDRYIRNEFCVTNGNLQNIVKASDVRFKELLKLMNMAATKYNNYKYRIGEAAEKISYGDPTILSIRDKLLKQADVKKYPYIIKFVEKFTRRADVTAGEDPNWLYCSKTNTKLLPSFLYTVARTYVLDKADFNKVIDNICNTRGVPSDDNSEIIDQYSGYVIRAIDLNAAEDFDENGKIITTREVAETEPITLKTARTGVEFDKSNIIAQSMVKIINQLSNTMGINVPDINFIVSNADTCLRYLIVKYKSKFKFMSDDVLLLIATLIYLFISLQTAIPSVALKSKIPGCHKSLDGFPLTTVSAEKSKYKGINVDGIVYLVCITKAVVLANKDPNNWWAKFAILESKEEIIVMIIATVIDVYVLPNNALVNQMINMKQIYDIANPDIDESKKTSIIQFLPPLKAIDITDKETAVMPSEFYKQYNEYIKTGNVKQFGSINTMYCKMMTFGLYVIQLIQLVVSGKKANMVSMSKKIYIENSCCPTSLVEETLKYFNSIDNNSIFISNNQVRDLNNKLSAIFTMSKAMIFFDNKNTKEQFPLLNDDFSENTKYRTLLFFCNYGSNKPIPSFLNGKCLKKPEGFNSSGTIEDQIKTLKDAYHAQLGEVFEGLSNALNNKNLVRKNNIKLIIGNPSARLVQILPDWSLFKDNYKKLVASKNPNTHMYNLDALNAFHVYLEKSNAVMKKSLKEVNDLLGVFDFPHIAKGGYLPDDMCNFVVFAKNTIRNLTRVFPSIILNKVNNEKVTIPKYLKLSSGHEKEIQEFVSEFYAPMRKSFSDESAKNEIIMTFMSRMKNLEEAAAITQHLVPNYNYKSDTKGEGWEYTTLNGLVTITLFNFYLYNILTDLVKTKPESLVKYTVIVLKGFLETMKKSKKCVEYDYVDMEGEVFDSAILEREKIKGNLRDMNKEKRVVEIQLKNLKLGRWGKAARKGFFEYDADFRDEEAAEALEDPSNVNEELIEVDDDDNGVIQGEEYAEGGEFDDDGGDYEDN